MATTSNFNWPTPDDTDLVRDGAEAIRDLGNAIDTTVAAGYRYVGTRYYTSSGTFAKADAFGDSSNVVPRAVVVHAQAAGGGGAGAGTTSAGQVFGGTGGSGGNYARTLITDIAGMAASVTITVGTGGAGGSGGADGTAGADSSFGTDAIAKGGREGNQFGALTPYQTLPGRTPVVSGDVGDLVIFGKASAGVHLINAGRVLCGAGGDSFCGTGALDSNTASGTNGNAGLGYGGGGGGAANVQSQAVTRDGGAGGNGIVWVDIYV